MAAKIEAEDGKNTFDPKRVEKIIGKIEREHEGLISEQASYRGKCRPYRERISAAYEEGVAFGIPKGVLKAKVRERDLQRKIDAIPGAFEDDEKDTFEQLTQALGAFGELPLGRAAINTAAKAEGRPIIEEPAADKPKRGRPKKVAPSTDAVEPAPPVVSGLDPKAVAENDDPTYLRGYDHAIAGGGCSVPSELCGLNRDRWHAGWLAGDQARKADGVAENADRLSAGIKGLPGAEAEGKATLQ